MTNNIQTTNRPISRAVKRVLKAQATQDGAGVSIQVLGRAFSAVATEPSLKEEIVLSVGVHDAVDRLLSK